MFTALLDYGPSVEPVYDSRSTTMTIMLIIIIFLCLLVIFLIGIIITNKKNRNSNITNAQISKEEQHVIDKYRNLKEDNKAVINKMLNSLDNNDLNKE